MFNFIRIKLNERVVVFQNGLPVGRSARAVTRLGAQLTEQRWDTDALVFTRCRRCARCCRAMVRRGHAAERERGILYRDGQPQGRSCVRACTATGRSTRRFGSRCSRSTSRCRSSRTSSSR